MVDTTPAVPGAPTRTGIGGRGGGPASQPAFPRSYEVVVSSDGTTWGNPLAQGQGKGVVNEISFAPTRAKFIRILQTGTPRVLPGHCGGCACWKCRRRPAPDYRDDSRFERITGDQGVQENSVSSSNDSPELLDLL